MYKGVDYVFIIPWFLLLALAVGFGLWRGRRHGASHGFKSALKVLGAGIAALILVYVAFIVVYYANGGH